MAAASADAAEPEEEEELVPTNPSRGLMYILISLHGMPNWMIRGGIFSWMPFVVRELGLSEAQRALLMGAWFPGYAFAQMPAAALIMRIGAKKVIGLNLLGTCGAYLALPFVAALGGSTAMQVTAPRWPLSIAAQRPFLQMRTVWSTEPLANAPSGMVASTVTPRVWPSSTPRH